MTVERRHRLPSSDGFTVAAWSAAPAAPTGTVVLCHGLTTGADDDGPFLPLRDRLLRGGLAVVRFDARCHGETGGDWSRLSLAGWRDDVIGAIGLAREIAPGPVLLLAASFSGGPAIAAIEHQDCAGLVLWNPVLDYRRTYLSDEFDAGAQVLATGGDPALPEWAAYRIPYAPVPLSIDLVEEMRRDRTAELAAGLRCPAIAFHGGSDQFVDIDTVARIAAGAPRMKLRRIPIARHGFRGIRPLIRILSARWLERAAAAHPRNSV